MSHQGIEFPSPSFSASADSGTSYLRLSVTDRCNFNCRYCKPSRESDPRHDGKPHPGHDQVADATSRSDEACSGAGLPPLDFDQILRAVGWIHAARPIRKIRLTGGEPLLRAGLPELVHRLRGQLPECELALTTNGSLLARHAGELREAGLDRVNVSLDTLDSAVFQSSAGGTVSLDSVIEGISAAREAGLQPVKINTVLQRTVNGGFLRELVRFAARRDCRIRFIELMRIGPAATIFDDEYLSAGEALDQLLDRWPDAERLGQSENALRYRFKLTRGSVDVGFIAPVSRPFCGECDRVRMDARGRLYGCLRQSAGFDLRPLFDDPTGGQDAVSRIRELLAGKKTMPADWPSETRMVSLGG